MSISVDEFYEPGGVKRTTSGTQIVRRFIVTDPSGAIITEYQAATAVGIPDIGDLHPEVNIPVTDVETDWKDHNCIHVMVTYSDTGSQTGGTNDLRPEYETATEDRTIYADVDDEAPIGDGGEGVTIAFPIGVFSYGADVSAPNLLDFARATGRVNSTPFLGADAGKWKCSGIVAQSRGENLWRCKFSFQYSEDGWSRQFRAADGTVTEAAVLKSADFSSLFPPPEF